MSNIRCNITELLQVLDIMPAEHNIMLVGNHGIGKSEILTEYYKAKGMRVVALFLGQMSDPGTGLTTYISPGRKTMKMSLYTLKVLTGNLKS